MCTCLQAWVVVVGLHQDVDGVYMRADGHADMVWITEPLGGQVERNTTKYGLKEPTRYGLRKPSIYPLLLSHVVHEMQPIETQPNPEPEVKEEQTSPPMAQAKTMVSQVRKESGMLGW